MKFLKSAVAVFIITNFAVISAFSQCPTFKASKKYRNFHKYIGFDANGSLVGPRLTSPKGAKVSYTKSADGEFSLEFNQKDKFTYTENDCIEYSDYYSIYALYEDGTRAMLYFYPLYHALNIYMDESAVFKFWLVQ